MSVQGAREYAATATIPQSAKEIIEQLCQEIERTREDVARARGHKAPQGWASGKSSPHNA